MGILRALFPTFFKVSDKANSAASATKSAARTALRGLNTDVGDVASGAASYAGSATMSAARATWRGGINLASTDVGTAARGTANLFRAIGVGIVTKPIGDGGLLIFFVSMLVYLFEMFYVPLVSFNEFYALKLPISIALFIMAIVLVQRKSGIVLGSMVIFWYFTDGTFVSYTGTFPEYIYSAVLFFSGYLIFYVLIMAGFWLIGYLSKAEGTSFLELIINDVGGFAVPFIIFLLDIGFASYIGTAFNLDVLSTVIESLFLNIPVWAMYGLITSNSERPIIHLLRNASVLYVVAILIMGIIPLLPQVTGADVPNPSDLIAAQQEKRAQLPEHILASQLACMFSKDYLNIPDCVKQRQAESKCKTVKEKSPEEYADCIATAKGEKPAITTGGVVDPSFNLPTSFTVTPGEGFLQQIDPTDSEPFLIVVQNPTKQSLELEIECNFIANKVTIPNAAGTYPLKVEEENPEPYPIICRSDSLPSGSGKWAVSVTAKKIETRVGLERAFVGENTELGNKIKSTYFSSADSVRSRGPADPARLDFLIGDPPLNPIIKRRDPQLIATIKNNGGGEIIAVHSSGIRISPNLFLPDNICELTYQGSGAAGGSFVSTVGSLSPPDQRLSDTLTNTNFKITGKEKIKEVRYALCDFSLTEAYQFPELAIMEYFESYLVYDYKITREFPVTINKVDGLGALT